MLRLSRSAWYLGLVLFATPVAGADFSVNETYDGDDWNLDGVCETAPGNGECTLRAAVEEAEAQAADDAIQLPPGIFELSLGALPDLLASDGRLSITGRGHRDTKIRGSDANPARFILTSGWLLLRDLELTNFESAGSGGAILSSGPLTIERCSLLANRANKGGSIYSDSELTIRQTAFANGVATSTGGEIDSEGLSGFLFCDGCIFETAHASAGGAIYFHIVDSHPLRIENSYFFGNEAGAGGALYINSPGSTSPSSCVLANSTIVGNQVTGSGGGIQLFGICSVYSSTISGNRADIDLNGSGEAGGVSVIQDQHPGRLWLFNSIVTGNLGSLTIQPGGNTLVWPQDCEGNVTSNGFNLVKDYFVGCGFGEPGCCAITGTTLPSDPQLLPAAYNGGSTATRATAPGSPAIDGGDPAGCADGLGDNLEYDQRGATRTSNGRCDLGAFEYGSLIYDDDFELWEWKWSAAVP